MNPTIAKPSALNVQPQRVQSQQGFTLIELMISLVLGLLISAAVMQVFLTSQRVDRIQAAGSEIQDKAVFGLQYIEPQVRLANLGNDGVSINDTTFNGGVVLTASDSSSVSANVITDDLLKSGYLTRSGDMASVGNSKAIWNGKLSNTDVPSDQLTIQYINTTGRILYDCEGKAVKPNEHVITRYFVTEGESAGSGARKNLNLNCNSGHIKDGQGDDDDDDDDNLAELKKFGKSKVGQVVVENIDQFNIRLGVQESVVNGGKTSYQYADMTVEEYMALPAATAKPPIVNIRIAILARSTANSPEASAESFQIFGSTQTLKPQTNAPNHLRRVYESNILLRNARIMRIIDNSTESKANNTGSE